MNLVIPMAGRSSRFPAMKPKWMLTHPSGQFMVLEAIKGLNLADFENIFFVYLEEHEELHHFKKGFVDELEDSGLLKKSKFVALKEATRDQPETVYAGIKMGGIRGPVFIKDSDNSFDASITPDNCVCFSNLNDCGLIKPKNKSYIMVNNQGNIVNIVEKQVISPTFCVGGYGFKDAESFVTTLNALPVNQERYISNVIYQLLLSGENFRAIECENYSDWGTIEDWDRYKRTFATLFVDLDGTLVENSSAHFPPYIGESPALESNVNIIQQLQASGKFEIIVTTSRPEKYRMETETQLSKLGLKYKYLLMGLQHSKRIIINDYSKSNPFKSCDSINLKRNSDELKEILRESLGIDYGDI